MPDFLPSRELFAVFLPISRKESLNRSYFARAQDALSITGKNRTILFEGLVNDAMRLVECAHLSVLHYQTKKAINTALFGDLAAYYLQKCLLFPLSIGILRLISWESRYSNPFPNFAPKYSFQ